MDVDVASEVRRAGMHTMMWWRQQHGGLWRRCRKRYGRELHRTDECRPVSPIDVQRNARPRYIAHACQNENRFGAGAAAGGPVIRTN
jgi:hypothetical protein